ncbi:TetR/AcrR family transcriptional regulator [Agromyces bauzanensis]|uniref:TetR/AcrR family transcriptional regulator n=1 Tax=Agromyces bauzanensis TaxID=1308924 RepID=UPI0031E9CB59
MEHDGVARLSLRDLARRVGVSHAAPAHHFGDRQGLFTAIATDGGAELEVVARAVAGVLFERPAPATGVASPADPVR